MIETASTLAPAKVNLVLDVLARRPDGYHDLRTIFHAIDWCDELRLTSIGEAAEDTLKVLGPFAEEVPADSGNLIVRAAAAVRNLVPDLPPVSFVLDKQIPTRAGLGGGSSDAVAALELLARVLGPAARELPWDELALSLGSDCPFFLRKGCQLGEGRGERLQPLPVIPGRFAFLVVVPMDDVPTPQAFAGLEEADKGPIARVEDWKNWLYGHGPKAFPPHWNAFQRGVVTRSGNIAEALAELESRAPGRASLTGSGSACFALLDSFEEARSVLEKLEAPARVRRVCRPRASQPGT